MNPLDTYFVNQSHNPGKLTFVNASFWEKRTAIHKPRRPFNFDFKAYPPRTILREVSRVSSLILKAKPWLAKKVLRHGNHFAARVRRRYFSKGEKRRPEMRLRRLCSRLALRRLQKTSRQQNHRPPKSQSGSKWKTYRLSAMILHWQSNLAFQFRRQGQFCCLR